MKINQIIVNESMGGTCAGAVATVESPMGSVQTRSPVKGLQPAEKVIKGKSKKKGPYQNSIVEGKKDKVAEAELQEDDLIVIPGHGMKRKTGFVQHGQSRVDHEVDMARSDLIASYKNAKAIFDMLKDRSEEEGIEGWVQEKLIKAADYLNAVKEYLDGKMAQESVSPGGVIAGGGVGEGLGYSRDPNQAKWYHEGRNAVKGGTIGSTIQDIAKKHGCPPEWLDAFRQGYRDQEMWKQEEMWKKRYAGVAEGYQLDEGAMETISTLVKKLPGIGKYYQIAQQYKPQLVQILKTSKSGKEVKQKMEALLAQTSTPVAEAGWMKQLGGLALGGGSILSTMWMNAMGMIDGVLAHAAAGEVGGAVASGSILGLIPVTLMLFAAMLLFKGSKQSSDEKAQQFQAQRGQQGVAEGSYADGSSIQPPGIEEWKRQYQQAVMAIKNAKTQQEYEAASDRAGRIKDFLASKGVQVGPVLGQPGVAEGSVLKSIKRGLQGWDKNAVGPSGEKLGNPRDIVKRAKAMDTDTAKTVIAGLDDAPKHSPAGLQKRVLDRKLKGVAEAQVNEKFASQQQAKLMYAVAGDKDVAKKTGVSQKVAKEFIKKSHGQKVKSLPKKVKKKD